MNEMMGKTVIVLNRNAKFAELTNEPFEINIKEGAQVKTIANCEKTIWSWCMEGLFEMHRVLTDSFPLGDQLIRFAVADFMGRMLESDWGEKMIDRKELINLLKAVECPSLKNTEINVIGGLMIAIEALAIESGKQKEKNDKIRKERERRMEMRSECERFGEIVKKGGKFKVESNKCGMIVFTSFKTDEEIENLENEVAKLVESRNQIALAASNKTFCKITRLNLFIVNYYVEADNCQVTTKPLKQNSKLPVLHTWVISRKATQMPEAIHSLLVAAFDLMSTTISKIPMKEENRGSANYDVELFHQKKVHQTLKRLGVVQNKNSFEFAKEGVTYETTRLAWATIPKTRWNLYPFHQDAVPCSPAVAYSRPSACLTQFVMDGRTVLLDLERTEKTKKCKANVSGKLISHILKANRGRIFIEAIDILPKEINKKMLTVRAKELPPPTEDLNMLQFRNMMNQMRIRKVTLDKLKKDSTIKEEKDFFAENPFGQIQKKLLRISRNMPLKAKDTFLFQPTVLKHFEPLIALVSKLSLSDLDVENCNAMIMKLLQKKDQRVSLIGTNTKINVNCVNNLKDPEEQMRVALIEMAKYMAKYVPFSIKHEQIYQTFVQTLGINKIANIKIDDVDTSESMFSFEYAKHVEKKDDWKEARRTLFEGVSETDEDDEEGEKKEVVEEDEDEKDEVPKKKLKVKSESDEEEEEEEEIIVKEVKTKEIDISLMDILCDNIETHVSKTRRDFAGRELYGTKATLYPNLIIPPPNPPQLENERKRIERGASGTPPPLRNNRY